MFDLPVIIANSGNRTEIISCICIGIMPPNILDSQYQTGIAGPYVLKAGDAVTVPLSLSFHMMQSVVGTGSETDVSVHLVALSDDNLIWIDIPVTRVSFSATEGQNRYQEQRSAGYKDGLIDVLSVPRSKFTDCIEGRSQILNIRVTPRQQPTPPPMPNFP
jgi:hypothetical protein